MKKLIAGVVLGVALTAVAHGAGDPQAGEQNAAVCASCHGQGGQKPIMAAYPKLAGLGETYLHNQLMAIQSGTRAVPQMAGQLDGKSDQELQDLAAYFDSQEMIVSQANPDLVDQGKALYRGGNMASGVPACAGCHNPRG
ncbi:MAG: cytochrome c, partial [Pseudomonadota bacterium]|nr:cytochrome c [Pseudomonadota bacterium]